MRNDDGEWHNHVNLGITADLMIIAPASANTIAKFANGICDNLLTATYLSARCSVLIAPAMDVDMLEHPSTKINLDKLISYGNKIIEPEYGELASGLEGKGRMADPSNIIAYLNAHFFKCRSPLKNEKVLITAGPTYEHIDPVRFIGNHSSGKMGCAIAQQAIERGAEVTLIHGFIQKDLIPSSVTNIPITSAQEMYEATQKFFETSKVTILSAAVSDFTPTHVFDKKLKKKPGQDHVTINLRKTLDIAASLGKNKKDHQLIIGFALETHDEEKNALKKLHSKNFDLIVLNSLNDKGAGFGHDTNRISILKKDNSRLDFNLKPKTEVANDILDEIEKLLET